MNTELEKAIHQLHGKLTENIYTFEFDTEDVVLGFKATKSSKTRSLPKALAMEHKLRTDLGRYISDTVRIVAVRLYRNGELRGEFKI